MAHHDRSWLALRVAPIATLLVVMGCDVATPSETSEDDPERRALAADLGAAVVLPMYRDFAASAAALEEATAAYASSSGAEEREAARVAWQEAMAIWQRAELTQIGPAGPMTGVAGGEDFRDEIYSWPLVNPCRVDQVLVRGGFEDAQQLAAEPVNARGLDAIEYLLFTDDPANACPSNVSINTEGQWDALGADEVARRRAAYAHAAAQRARSAADMLVAAWEPTSGSFLAQLETAGTTGTTYGSSQEALNAISDAMFYLDDQTKDMKLAEPGGISLECLAETCPERVESPFARRSVSHVENNLRGFRELFLGGPPDSDANGFDDLLASSGAEATAARMSEALDAAIARAAAMDASLVDALSMDLAAVRGLYDAVKAVTDVLKTEFVSVLDLDLPRRAEGDND